MRDGSEGQERKREMMDKAGFLEELKQRERFLENEAFDLASLSERLDELEDEEITVTQPGEKPVKVEIPKVEEDKANNAKNLLAAISGTMKALRNVRFMISRISSSLEMDEK